MPKFERPVLADETDYCWDGQSLIALSESAYLALNLAIKNQAYPFILNMISCDKLQLEAGKINVVDFISEEFNPFDAIETLQMFVAPIKYRE
ncbi:MAG: hypothetical protein ABII80_01810 [bacterium]